MSRTLRASSNANPAAAPAPWMVAGALLAHLLLASSSTAAAAEEATGAKAPSGETSKASEASESSKASEASETSEAGTASSSAGGLLLGLGAGFYFDGAQYLSTERRSIQEEQEDLAVTNDNRLQVSLAALVEILPHARVGGEVAYLGTYSYTRDDDEQDPPEVFELGELFELTLRAEYGLGLMQRLELLLGGRAGLPVLFPGGGLDSQIRALQEQDVGVWGGPHLGYLFGAELGARYLLSDQVGVRLTAAKIWEHLILFDVSEEISGVEFSRDTTLGISRTTVALGLDVAL